MIKEVIIEPSQVYTGQAFKVKIKSMVTFDELKDMTWQEITNLTWQEIERGA